MLGFEAGKRIAQAVSKADPNFSQTKYTRGLKNELEPLELKERMIVLRDRLSLQLSPDPTAFKILLKSLSKGEADSTGLKGFHVWPLTEFVAIHGLDDYMASLKALKEMTKVFTGEFSIRPFLLKYETEVLKILLQWSRDSNHHVRRLVSEGTRPTLPWGKKLNHFLQNPELTWPLLNALKNDSSEYVQKSVANHLNDLSKVHGDWVVQKIQDWPNQWIVKHACRTLIKQGHRGALKINGFDTKVPELISSRLKKKKIKVGEQIEITCSLKNIHSTALNTLVDVEVHFLKKNGKHNPKVFKGRSLVLKKNETTALNINIPLRPVTTRSYYPGIQKIRLIINGQKSAEKKFELECL